jgi:tetratricopeptide (TPR) repeat protein
MRKQHEDASRSQGPRFSGGTQFPPAQNGAGVCDPATTPHSGRLARRLTRLILASFGALTLAGCASSRALCVEEGGSPWREIRTAHFSLKTNLSSEGAQQSALELEQFRGALVSLLWPGSMEPPGLLDTIVVRNPSQLAEFAGPGIAGYFAYGSRGSLLVTSSHTYLAGDYGLDLAIVAHELTHYLSFLALARQPLWLAEGLATFMETARILPGGERVEMGALPSSWLRTAQRRRVPVQTLWEWGAVDVDPDEKSELYATSWLLVHLLINHHAPQLAEFLDRLATAQEPRPAFAAAFPGLTFEQLDRELANYVTSGKYAVVQVKTKAEDAPMKERALTSADVHLLRARLWQSSASGLSEAEAEQRALAEVNEALRHAPTNADALVMKQVLAPTKEGAQALTGQFPHDPRAWKALAASLGKDHRGQAQALALAITLGSKDVEVFVALAQVLITEDKPEAALEVAEQALILDPRSIPALVAVSRANEELGLCARAAQAITRALERMGERESPQRRNALLEKRQALAGSCRP